MGCRSLVERDNAVVEVLIQHGFDAFSQIGPAAPVGEPGDTVEQLRDGDGREMDVGRGLPINPVNDELGRRGSQ